MLESFTAMELIPYPCNGCDQYSTEYEILLKIINNPIKM
jgi:hypothetical protein